MTEPSVDARRPTVIVVHPSGMSFAWLSGSAVPTARMKTLAEKTSEAIRLRFNLGLFISRSFLIVSPARQLCPVFIAYLPIEDKTGLSRQRSQPWDPMKKAGENGLAQNLVW
jgi:aminoglycoside N3'-acetyltransferase